MLLAVRPRLYDHTFVNWCFSLKYIAVIFQSVIHTDKMLYFIGIVSDDHVKGGVGSHELHQLTQSCKTLLTLYDPPCSLSWSISEEERREEKSTTDLYCSTQTVDLNVDLTRACPKFMLPKPTQVFFLPKPNQILKRLFVTLKSFYTPKPIGGSILLESQGVHLFHKKL